MKGKRKLYWINGESKTLTEWAREYGVNPDSVRKKLRRGKGIIEALQPKSDDGRKCNRCIHGWKLGFEWGCQYILDTGRMRKSPVIGCDKFKPGVHPKDGPMGARAVI